MMNSCGKITMQTPEDYTPPDVHYKELKSGSIDDASVEDWDRIRGNQFDPVDKPSHYNQGKLETIKVIEDTLTYEQFKGYLWGNIIKYSSRWEHKNGVEDLKKMQWYTDKLISFVEGF